MARKANLSPEAWAKCLLGACYSLYFLSLPCRLMLSRGKEHATLRAAYELLERATKLRVPCDEVRMYQLLEPKNEEVVVHLCWEKLSSFL